MQTVRITSGSLRGRRVRTPPGEATRPLLSRLRKSLVDVLRPHLQGSRVLDLFGGSGAIALELLSNGAASAVVVELAPKTAELVRENAAVLGVADRVQVVTGDAIATVPELAALEGRFEVIVVAPPYGKGLQQAALRVLGVHPLWTPDGLVVVQRERSEDQVAAPAGLVLARSRAYGRTCFDFYAAEAT